MPSNWKASLAKVQQGEGTSAKTGRGGSKNKQDHEASSELGPDDEQADDDGEYLSAEEEAEEESEYEGGEEGRPGRTGALFGFDAGGAMCWADVEEDMEEQAEELVDNIASSTMEASQQRNTILGRLFATEAAGGREVADPLGLGVLDLQAQAIVEEGTLVTGRRGRGKGLAQQGDKSGPSDGKDGSKAAGGHPAEVRQLLPDHEEFAPDLFLGTFHKDTRLVPLRRAVKTLSSELSERHNQMKQLIRENFERFTSCQSTIDDIYAKLQKAEGMGFTTGKARSTKDAKPKAAAAAGAAMKQQQPLQGGAQVGGPEGLQQAIAGLQAAAQHTWGDVLQRAAQADRIRSVTTLLARFNNLFGMPGRIKALAAEGSLDQVVAEYKRANALIRPTATSARVWVTLHQEIEKRVVGVYAASKAALLQPALDAEGAPDRIVFMAQLAQQRLPGTHEEDAMRLFLDTTTAQLDSSMVACDARLTSRLQQLRAQLDKDPATRSAALDFAAAWKLQGPTAWQLDVAERLESARSGEGPDAPSGDLPLAQPPTRSRARTTSHGSGRSQRRRTGGAKSGRHTTFASEVEEFPISEDEEEEEGREGDEEGEGEGEEGQAWAGGGLSRAHTAASTVYTFAPSEPSTAAPPRASESGVPAAPGTLEDLALLMWPGPADWKPEAELAPAMQADLQWRLQAATPRSQLLPEPSFRLAPAQSAWAKYVADLCSVLVDKLPGLWAVATAAKLAQASEVPPAVYESMLSAPALTTKLVEGAIAKYAARLQVALQALSQAGPLCPAVELVVKELCRSWRRLGEQHTTPRALTGLQAAALSALNLYAACLKQHLAAAPSMILEGESWALDAGVRDQQPVTCLPRKLQEEVALVMFHFGRLSAACEEVDAGAVRTAWLPVREGLCACFAAWASLLAAYAASLQRRVDAAAATHADPTAGASTSTTAGHSLAGLQRATNAAQITQAAQQLGLTPLASVCLEEVALLNDPQALIAAPPARVAASRATSAAAPAPVGRVPSQAAHAGWHARQTQSATGACSTAGQSRNGSQGGAAVSHGGLSGRPSTVLDAGQVLPSALGPHLPHLPISRADEVKALLLVSNSLWLQAKVAPELVDAYREQLAGASDGDKASQYEATLSNELAELQRAAGGLLDVVLQHRMQLAGACVKAYLRLVCEGCAAAAGGTPPHVSDACLALITHLVYTHTMVVSCCARSVLGRLLPTLLQHMAEELCSSYAILEAGSTSTYALLQLYVDTMYCQLACQAALPPAGDHALAAAATQLRALIRQALRLGGTGAGGHQSAPLSSLHAAAAAAGSAGDKALARELNAWARQLVQQCMQHTQCNVACFSAAMGQT